MVRHLSLSGPSSTLRTVFWKVVNSLLQWYGFESYGCTLWVSYWSLHKIHMSSFSTTDAPNGLLVCVQEASCLPDILDLLQSLFLLCPSHPWHPLLSRGIELEQYFWKYNASRIWWGLCKRHCAALLMMEATRCSNYSLILEGLLWHTQDHWTPTFQWLLVHLVHLAWCHHFTGPVGYSVGCTAGPRLFRLCGDRGHQS